MSDNPARYKRNGVEVFEFIKGVLGPEQWEGFLRGNALKYLARYEYKGGSADLVKCADYLSRLLEAVGDKETRSGC